MIRHPEQKRRQLVALMAVPPEHSTVRHTYDAHRGATTAGCDDARDGRAEATRAGAMRGPPGPGGGIRPRWSLSSSRAAPAPAAEQGGERKLMASPRAGRAGKHPHGDALLSTGRPTTGRQPTTGRLPAAGCPPATGRLRPTTGRQPFFCSVAGYKRLQVDLYKNAAAEENIVHEPRGARSANQQTATMGRAHEEASAKVGGEERGRRPGTAHGGSLGGWKQQSTWKTTIDRKVRV